MKIKSFFSDLRFYITFQRRESIRIAHNEKNKFVRDSDVYSHCTTIRFGENKNKNKNKFQ